MSDIILRDCDKNDERSIEDNFYLNHPKVYNYAMAMTKKELKQAVEGLYHNLK